MRKIVAICLCCMMACLSAIYAQSLEQVKVLAQDGEMQQAIEMIKTLITAQPKNADLRKELGDLLLASGNNSEAKDAYAEAHKMGSKSAILALAEMANIEYRTDEARKLLEDYRKTLKKGKRVVGTDESGDLDERIARTENMLTRVESIVVVDSMIVDAEDFFRHYHLSAESGRLLSPSEALPQGFSYADPTVVYRSESGRQMLWAAPDKEGVFELVSSSPLYGDEWEKPQSLGDGLGEGGDANYPFLMPDGVTLYFSNDGDDSLGGLDIFISRRGETGFLQPQNLGLPYNSPYDDYMLAIDETTGVGWWASDRNHIPGKVTIYVYIPTEMRRNVDADDPELLSLARLSSIAKTWPEGFNRKAVIDRIVALDTERSVYERQFEFYIPERGLFTTLSEFRTPAARQAMKEFLDAKQTLAVKEERLAGLRQKYVMGDKSCSEEILELEKAIVADYQHLKALRNDVITLER